MFVSFFLKHFDICGDKTANSDEGDKTTDQKEQPQLFLYTIKQFQDEPITLEQSYHSFYVITVIVKCHWKIHAKVN